MKNNILVLGHFGSVTNQLDGQTVKTRSIYSLLEKNMGVAGNVTFFDTQCFRQNKLFILKMFWMIFCNGRLVYIPATNNLNYLFPFIFVLCKLKRVEIIYIAVGGWLVEYLNEKPLYVHIFRGFRVICVQSHHLKDNLIRQHQLNNVIVLPNFRIHNFIPSIKKPSHDSFKIVFMARINRMKGIEAVFRFAEYLETQQDESRTISIDFYGPIEKKDETFFREQVGRFSFISYKGILEPEQIYDTLTTYDLSILPTKYPGEGFPGTILDSYISGVPVIVSDWKFSPEFVDHGKTGYVFRLSHEEEFYDYIMKLYADRNLLFSMKQNALEESKKYSSESAWGIICKYLDL